MCLFQRLRTINEDTVNHVGRWRFFLRCHLLKKSSRSVRSKFKPCLKWFLCSFYSLVQCRMIRLANKRKNITTLNCLSLSFSLVQLQQQCVSFGLSCLWHICINNNNSLTFVMLVHMSCSQIFSNIIIAFLLKVIEISIWITYLWHLISRLVLF